jgi:Kef-type K+ transport system membrane component KefB
MSLVAIAFVLALLYGGALLLGRTMHRIGLPRLLGELLTGCIFGAVLSQVPASLGERWLQAAASAANDLGQLGVLLLVALAAAQVDRVALHREKRIISIVAAGGLLIPIPAGVALATRLPLSFHGMNASVFVFVSFVAILISVTAIPILISVLTDLGALNSSIGRVMLAVAVVDDAVGWLIIFSLTVMARGRSEPPPSISYLVAVTAIVTLSIILPGIATLIVKQKQLSVDHVAISRARVFICAALAVPLAAGQVGLEPILVSVPVGFFAGRIIPQGPAAEALRIVVARGLAPFFFLTVGVALTVGWSASDDAILWIWIIMVVCLSSKFIGIYLAARWCSISRRPAVCAAVGLNTRGAIQIVFAQIGLNIGVFTHVAFATFVIVGILSTFLSALALRFLLTSAHRDWSA